MEAKLPKTSNPMISLSLMRATSTLRGMIRTGAVVIWLSAKMNTTSAQFPNLSLEHIAQSPYKSASTFLRSNMPDVSSYNRRNIALRTTTSGDAI